MKNSLEDVLSFWFVETTPVQWFQVSPVFDEMVKERFLDLFRFASQGFCDEWENSADGAMALTLLFDQFPRNMFRDATQSYETDEKARAIARQAIDRGFDQLFISFKRRFFYLPFEHSESLDDQRLSVELFSSMREDEPLAYEYAVRHFKVIERFGRFPHRNKILGRESSSEEIKFLEEFGRF